MRRVVFCVFFLFILSVSGRFFRRWKARLRYVNTDAINRWDVLKGLYLLQRDRGTQENEFFPKNSFSSVNSTNRLSSLRQKYKDRGFFRIFFRLVLSWTRYKIVLFCAMTATFLLMFNTCYFFDQLLDIYDHCLSEN